jgi:pimeloyl-ACP methyl ester carboxylesterase
MQRHPREESHPAAGGAGRADGNAAHSRAPGGVVRTRTVFHIPGYDPAPPAAVRRRFVRELRHFQTTWCAQASVSEAASDAEAESWQIVTTGANWRVATDFRLVRWDDIIAASGRLPMWRRIPLGLVAFADFAVNALGRYLRANWRYALFFLFPFLLFAVFAGLALLAALITAGASGSLLLAIAAALAVLAVLMRWPGRRFFVPLLFDDWIFSRRYLRHGHPVLTPRLDRFADELVALARRQQADEILVVGHSLGAALAIDILDRALQRFPDLGRTGPRVTLISVGSSVLKIGLHARAEKFRGAVQRVASAAGIFWVDYQAISDVMNFYKRDPIATMGLSTPVAPMVRVVRFRHMLEPSAYARMRYDLFRLHCQFVSGNSRRAAYDYFMLLCGPLPAESQARSPDGAGSAIAADGRLLDAAGGAGESAPMPVHP